MLLQTWVGRLSLWFWFIISLAAQSKTRFPLVLFSGVRIPGSDLDVPLPTWRAFDRFGSLLRCLVCCVLCPSACMCLPCPSSRCSRWRGRTWQTGLIPRLLLVIWSLVAQMVENLPAVQETWVWSLGREDPPEKGLATHSSVLAWIIPWTEKPGGLHDWAANTFTLTQGSASVCGWKRAGQQLLQVAQLRPPSLIPLASGWSWLSAAAHLWATSLCSLVSQRLFHHLCHNFSATKVPVLSL